jgi:hypothetical protein
MDSAKKIFSKDMFKIDMTNSSQYFYVTLVLIIFILLVLFSWIFNKLGLKNRSCKKLEIYWPHLTNITFFTDDGALKPSAVSTFREKFINYYVKSAYNCCCGDGYKNNFVALCALEKCILNGCRFLDFELYSYNNEPIIASSTANSNYIKETYNSILLEDALVTITEKAFHAETTNCYLDPLILNFRVMSTNLAMLKKMGDLFTEYLDNISNSQVFSLVTTKDGALLATPISNLSKKLIIICDFNPQPNICDTYPKELTTLKNYINLKGTGTFCNTFRYNQVVSKKGTASFLSDTKTKFTIVLPNLDNSIINFEPVTSYVSGCQAICMKHQNMDTNLLGYNELFKENKNFSWILKPESLSNVSAAPLTPAQGGFYGTIKFTRNRAGTEDYNIKLFYDNQLQYTNSDVTITRTEPFEIIIDIQDRLRTPTSILYIRVGTPNDTITQQPGIIRPSGGNKTFDGVLYKNYFTIPASLNGTTITFDLT